MIALRFWVYRKTSGLGLLPPGVARNHLQARVYALNETILEFNAALVEAFMPVLEATRETLIKFIKAFQELEKVK